MAYIKANLGGGAPISGGGVFPALGKALTFEGFCYESSALKDISLTFSIAQGGTASPVYGLGAGFIANIKDTGFTAFSTNGAGGAYAMISYFDADGNQLTGGGRSNPNGSHTIPADTMFVYYMANNYNDTAAHTITVSFT